MSENFSSGMKEHKQNKQERFHISICTEYTGGMLNIWLQRLHVHGKVKEVKKIIVTNINFFSQHYLCLNFGSIVWRLKTAFATVLTNFACKQMYIKYPVLTAFPEKCIWNNCFGISWQIKVCFQRSTFKHNFFLIKIVE